MKKVSQLIVFVILNLCFIVCSAKLVSAISDGQEKNIYWIDNNDIKLTDTQILKFDKYIEFDSERQLFAIIPEAGLELTSEEFDLLVRKLNETNSKLNSINLTVNEEIQSLEDGIVITRTNREVYSYPGYTGFRSRFVEGKDAVAIYWWGIRIWLSRTTVQYLGQGITIGGIWVPEPLVSKVLSTAGVVVSLCPGGIVFNSTPPLATFWGFEFQ